MGRGGRLARNQVSILDLLAETDRELAGVEVADAVGGLARSSVYGTLAVLQRDGLIKARWDVEGERPRRVFRITPQGREALRLARAETRAYGGRLIPQGGLS